MFDEMIERIQNNTIALLLKVRIEVNRPTVQPVAAPKPAPAEEEVTGAPFVAPISAPDPAQLVTNSSDGTSRPTVKSNKTPGRNDPCPCGSGKKYKNCCGKNQ